MNNVIIYHTWSTSKLLDILEYLGPLRENILEKVMYDESKRFKIKNAVYFYSFSGSIKIDKDNFIKVWEKIFDYLITNCRARSTPSDDILDVICIEFNNPPFYCVQTVNTILGNGNINNIQVEEIE